jgi:hypothetical protein
MLVPAAEYIEVGDPGHEPQITGIAADPSGVIFVATDIALYALKVGQPCQTCLPLDILYPQQVTELVSPQSYGPGCDVALAACIPDVATSCSPYLCCTYVAVIAVMSNIPSIDCRSLNPQHLRWRIC